MKMNYWRGAVVVLSKADPPNTCACQAFFHGESNASVQPGSNSGAGNPGRSNDSHDQDAVSVSSGKPASLPVSQPSSRPSTPTVAIPSPTPASASSFKVFKSDRAGFQYTAIDSGWEPELQAMVQEILDLMQQRPDADHEEIADLLMKSSAHLPIFGTF
jgi:hypothetical protein